MEDKLWFTYKARIEAEARLRNNDLHSQVLLVWYAVVSAVFSVIAIRYPAFLGQDTDVISAVLSIALLAISMLVANRDFRGRASAMQVNYIAIKKLYEGLKSDTAINLSAVQQQYSELLQSTENHTPYDDRYARIFSAEKLTTRKPTPIEKTLLGLHLFFRVGTATVLYVGPLALMFLK